MSMTWNSLRAEIARSLRGGFAESIARNTQSWGKSKGKYRARASVFMGKRALKPQRVTRADGNRWTRRARRRSLREVQPYPADVVPVDAKIDRDGNPRLGR